MSLRSVKRRRRAAEGAPVDIACVNLTHFREISGTPKGENSAGTQLRSSPKRRNTGIGAQEKPCRYFRKQLALGGEETG